MEIKDKYATISAPVSGIYKEKGSKFLAFAYPVSCSDDVKPIIDTLKKEYFDARHHCYAYRIGVYGENFRANDDGEPSGTAGKPILGQMISANISNVLIIVVRYFGGIKLGTSGLIKAYRTAAADAIANANIIEKTENDTLEFSFEYVVINDIMRLIKDEKTEILEQILEINCKMKISVQKSKSKIIIEKLSKIESVNIDQQYSAKLP